MLERVATAYVDATAASLRLALDLPPQPALGAAVVEVGPFAVELRVLGASHQAIARGRAGELSETVACLDASGGGPLPAEHGRAGAGLFYAFTSAVERLAPDDLRARAEALRAACADDPLALAGVFPGSPDALTALRCRPVEGGVGWETVHLYPRTGELVTTASTVRSA